MSRRFASPPMILAGALAVGVLVAGHGIAQVNLTGVAKRVTIGSALEPQEVRANPGDTLIWRNATSAPVILSLDGVSFSEHKALRVEPGGSVSMYFAKPGNFQYSVRPAGAAGGASPPPMTGTIVIIG